MKKQLSFRSKNQSRRKQGGWKRFFRYWYIRLVRLQGHPREIARGLAVGVFSGFFPWFGLQIIIAIFLAILCRGNKIAAAAATWISNPLTNVPIFIFNYKVGEWLLGDDTPIDLSKLQSQGYSLETWTELGSDVLNAVFFGSFAIGTVAAILTYFLSLRLLTRWHQKRQEKRMLKRI